MTGGNATGGNDVFNGKNRIFWYLDKQEMLTGFGRSFIYWGMCVNWNPGDNCHRVQNASVTNPFGTLFSTSLLHAFSGGHVHTGDWPPVNSLAQGGFTGGYYYIDHDVNGNANVVLTSSHVGSSGPTSTATINTALPQIPQTAAPPTAATVTRVSDTQQTVNWTNNSTGTAPYANIKVHRSTDGGGAALIATLGVVVTYSDTATLANHKYAYSINAVGANTVWSAAAVTSAVWTTPGAPSTLTAAKVAGGNINLTWVNNVSYSEYTVRIEESQNGGAYSEIASVATGVTSWAHVAPNPAVTHKYRIRARTTTGTTLNSSYSNESATIVLLSTAGAPTGLAPSGVAADAAEAIVFTWNHNPTDGTPQTKYQLQYKVDAGGFVTVGPTTSGVSSYTLPAATLTNAHTITWHVATAAENGTVGAYSADSVFTTSARPTSTISQPSGGVWNLSAATTNWTYFQAQGSAQASWHAYLYHKLSAVWDDAELVGEQAGSGAAATATFTGVTLLDGQTYAISVTVVSAAGLSSTPAGTDFEQFTVSYLPPAPATITATYDEPSGSMVLTVDGADPIGGVSVAIDTIAIQRSINGGPWVTIIEGLLLAGLPLTAVVIDTAPTINGNNVYRALVFSATPSSAVSAEEVAVTAEPQWSFLSAGPGFEQVVRMKATPRFKAKAARVRALHRFAGRVKPVQLEGEAESLAIGVEGTLRDSSSTAEEYEAIAVTSGVVLWREPTGRRVFASLTQVGTERSNHRRADVAFDLTEVDYTEGV